MKRYVYKRLGKNVLSSLIYKAKYRKDTVSITRKMGKQAVAYNGILLSNKKKQTSDRCTNLGESDKHAEWRRFSTKEYILYLEQIKTNLSWKQKPKQNSVTWWEWDQGLTWRGIRELSTGNGNVLYLMEVWVTQVYMHLLELSEYIIMVWTFHCK